MKIPRTPPAWSDILVRKAESFAAASIDPAYRAVIRDAQQKYRHWDKVRIICGARGIDAELAWAVIKMGRLGQRRTLTFESTTGEKLWFTSPDPVLRELMHVDQELAGRLAADDERPIGPVIGEQYILSALMDEAIASSQLEGAHTTRRIAKEMLRSGRKPRDNSERMITNNYRAIGFIREHRMTPLSAEFILELQSILTRDTLEKADEVGRWRRDDERIAVVDHFGETLHEPPPGEELPNRLKTLCTFANADDTADVAFIHPVIRAILLHFQLAYDHPFCDGNGRTARALFYWSLLRRGYWMFEYLPISRYILKGAASYGRAFLYTETDEFDATYFLAHQARIIGMAREEFSAHLLKQQRRTLRARQLFADDDRLNDRQRTLLLRLKRGDDVIATIDRHRADTGVAYGTARSDLLFLARWKYLTQARIGKRFEFFPGPRLKDSDENS